MRRGNWYRYYGSWWALQWQWASWLSLGLHVDLGRHSTAKENIRYGPYVDFHLGVFILSLGVNPIWATDIGSLTYRSGFSGDSQ